MMQHLVKNEALELLQRLLFLERKTEFIKGIDIEKHKVIQMWEKNNFADKIAFRIVNQLSDGQKLDEIAEDMEKHLEMNDTLLRSDINVKTTLSSYNLLAKMVRVNEKLLNDLIIFLTLCPLGLGITEIEVLLNMIPSNLDQDVKESKIALYIKIFKQSLESENLILDEKGKDVRDIVKRLMSIELQTEPCEEIIVKLYEHENEALDLIVRSNSQVEEQISNFSSSDLLEIGLDFFLKYSKYLLFQLKKMDKESKKSDYQLFMKAIKQNFGARFHLIKQNIFNLLKKDKVESLVPNLLIN